MPISADSSTADTPRAADDVLYIQSHVSNSTACIGIMQRLRSCYITAELFFDVRENRHLTGLAADPLAAQTASSTPSMLPMSIAGIAWDGSSPSWDSMWAAIKAVWASKWNSRAVSSLQKAGLQHKDLQMAVLCQPLIPAQYAFEAHMTNPTTGVICRSKWAVHAALQLYRSHCFCPQPLMTQLCSA